MTSYQHYLDNLAGKRVPIHDGHPQPGFYKRRLVRNGPWVAAAIWPDGKGALLCRVGNAMRDAAQEWTWIAKHPVPEADALHYFQHGQWPEMQPASAPLAGPGHNLPPPDAQPAAAAEAARPADPYQNLVARIERAMKATAQWVVPGAITTHAQANAAGDRLDELRGLVREMKKRHDSEKAPHLAECRRVDDRYLPWCREIEAIGKKLREAIGTFADKVAAETDEAQLQLAANERARQEPSASAKIQFGATGHRKVGVRVVREVQISDRAKLWRKYRKHARVIAAVDAAFLELAKEAIGRGETVPGITVTERRIAA